MRWKIMTLNIVFALFLTTFMYSALNVDIKLSTTRATYSIEGDYLVTNIPVSIENRGFYPIKDIKIWITIENNSKEILCQEFKIGEISPLHIYVKNFVLRINLTNMYEKLGNGFALQGGQLQTRITIDARYWVLANVHVNYVRTSWWTPLISEFKIDTKNIMITDGKIVIPYVFKSAFQINGKINIVVKDANQTIAVGNSTLVCGKKANVYLDLMENPMDLISEKWKIIATIYIGHMKFTSTAYYNFVSPMDGL